MEVSRDTSTLFLRTYDMNTSRIARSWATTPMFYEAPYPSEGRLVPSPYQHAGVEYRVQRRFGMFGDAPGLGKTAECILTSNTIEAKRTLVLCPASLRLNWEREVWLWSNIENVSTYPILSSKDGVSYAHDYVIASYDALRNDGIYTAMMGRRWDHLILDEAHYLKDPHGNVRTTRTIGGVRKDVHYEGLISRCDYVTGATGTPMPNQPIEIYNIARVMDWDSIGRMSLESFRNYYYDEGYGFKIGWYEKKLPDGGMANVYGRHKGVVRNVPRIARVKELQKSMRGSWLVRRLKEHVLKQLPKKEYHLLPVEITAKIRQVMKHEGWVKAERLYDLNPDNFDQTIPIEGAISTARRLMGEAKVSIIISYCEQLLNEGVEKLIVSAWHHSVLDKLHEKLKPYGLVYMDGRTSITKKQAAVDDFQTKENIRIILGQQQPLGLGWTLAAAQDVVYAEFDWVPGVNDQLLDRAHRIGQKGSYVLGHIPYVPGTLEEKILNKVVDKARVIYAGLDQDEEYNHGQ